MSDLKVSQDPGQQLDAAVARTLLRYEPESGKLYWRERSVEHFASSGARNAWNARYSGKEAFTFSDDRGYRQGRVLGRKMRAHRLIWLMQTGSLPEGEVDHLNGCKVDNRWVNLTDASKSQNARNTKLRSTNTSGVNGVRWSARRQRWIAYARITGRQVQLGCFHDLQTAAAARAAANAEHGFSERHGRAS